MNQRKSKSPKVSESTSTASHLPSAAAVRETIEQVAIALILAFLFRTFEAEAFVIPTGSMATTLMGRHKDLECPKCGHPYRLNASDEVDSITGASRGTQVSYGICPQCRWTAYLGPGNTEQEAYDSYTGDRILVDKFAYQWEDPQRWDVAVFKFPGEAKTNYIKRVVGLPGETVRIARGDIYVKRQGEDEFRIARKPPPKIVAMLRDVNDNDYQAGELLRRGWPLSWQASDPRASGAWQSSDDHRELLVDGTAADAWVRYWHYVPSSAEWQPNMPAGMARPQLITDFSAYNTGGVSLEDSSRRENHGLHWVGDLALECQLTSRSGTGGVWLELVKGGRRFTCRFDLATGRAVLGIDGQEDFKPSAPTALAGPGTHRVRFSNVDRQLTLWVDGRVVEFDAPTTYADLGNNRPTTADLAPVGIGSQKAALEVRHLKVLRDTYYIATRVNDMVDDNYPVAQSLHGQGPGAIMSDPRQWSIFDNMGHVEFTMGPDQFFALGDNSAHSRDGRLWGQDRIEHFVKRELLTGRALYVYWPHHLTLHVNLLGLRIPIPFVPNIPQMRFVR